ncbi:unnamed protein product [Schistosoma mattheei]|uniref:Uncharacterized protein n=1 Tax=Schistosoma mattheei TaxID=31246 RepID=A0A183PRC8_9TREM|nr:unnamed protein product [Schistosoma mattheei]
MGWCLTKSQQGFEKLVWLLPTHVIYGESEICLSIKGRVYCTAVRPVLLYGCETWPVRDHWVSNSEVRRRVLGNDGKSVDEVVNFPQLRWLDHVPRMPEHRLPRRAMLTGVGNSWKKLGAAKPKRGISP